VTNGQLVAVITGGTHGIGRHAAETLASDGWSVAVCSRHEDEAVDAAAQLAATFDVPTYGAAADVRSSEELRRLADSVRDRLGPPMAAIANAGVLGPVGPLHTVDLAEWAAAVEIDLIGVANTLAVFGAQMVEQRRGRLITMSGGGVGGPSTNGALSAYTSSKAAVVALTESVSRELESYGVWVNAVAPGAIATRFMEPVFAAGASQAGEKLFEQTARQRQNPDSLADFDAVLRLLVSPTAPPITGRMLSARWDDLAALRAEPPSSESSLYRLRRIDGVLFDATNKEN
jgi:3-oxoacyl-[acyl-carrier protein] reductase